LLLLVLVLEVRIQVLAIVVIKDYVLLMEEMVAVEED